MKIILTLLLAITVTSLTAQSKYELIVGLRTGVGAPILSYTATQGQTKSIQNCYGVYIPAKAEILFGIKGFRVGYMFNYNYNRFTHFTSKIKQDNFAPQALPSNGGLKNFHIFNHMAVLEYNIPVHVKAAKFLLGPMIGIGCYTGTEYSYGYKSQLPSYLKNRVIIMAGFNIELKKGAFSFVFSPVYTYQHATYKYLETYNDKQTMAIHNIGIDIGIRVNLFGLKHTEK